MPDDNEQDEKKIIIDEDWKSQVEAEKEAAAGGQPQQARKSDKEPESAEAFPPPTLTFLASTLYLQGAIAMGLLPNPISDKPAVQLNQARHAIDLLIMLQEKTQGNRTPEETGELEEMLHQLRMAFISVSQK
jgi:hypothetical protein